MAVEMSAEEVRGVIVEFLGGEFNPWDWDDFISTPIKSNYLNSIRLLCLFIPDKYPPPSNSTMYCSDLGLDRLRMIAAQLL